MEPTSATKYPGRAGRHVGYAGSTRGRVAGRAAPAWATDIRRDPFRLALLALVVITISRVHQHFGFLAAIRPALVLFLAALGFALTKPGLIRTRALFQYWPAKVMVGLGVMACLSVPFGISIGGSATFIISDYSKVLIVGLLLVLAIQTVQHLRWFIWAYVISCGILVWMATTVFSLSRVAGTGVTRIQDLYTYDSNDMGLVLLVGLPLTVLLYETSKGWQRWLAAMILVGIGIALALSGSRGAFVGLIVTGTVMLFALKHIAVVYRWAAVGVVAIALVLAAPPGYWTQMSTLTDPTADYNWSSTYGRRQVALRGLGYMAENPVTGIGVGNFGRAEGTLSAYARDFVDETGARIKWSAAHNSFIQVAAEMGIPGLILWSLLPFGGLVTLRRLRRSLPRAWARGDPDRRFLYATTLYLPIAIVGFLSTCIFVSFAYLDPIYYLGALIAGCLAVARPMQSALRAQAQAGQPRQVRSPVGTPRMRTRRAVVDGRSNS